MVSVQFWHYPCGEMRTGEEIPSDSFLLTALPQGASAKLPIELPGTPATLTHSSNDVL